MTRFFKILFWVLAFWLVNAIAYGQSVTVLPGNARGIDKVLGGLKTDSVLWLPVRTLMSWTYANPSQIPNIGRIGVSPHDTNLYYVKSGNDSVRVITQGDTTIFNHIYVQLRDSTTQWVTFTQLKDTAAAIRAGGGGGSGTVTSVSAGWGTNFTTITNSGSVIVDSSEVTTFGTSRRIADSAASAVASGYVPTSRTLTINGSAQDLSANRSWSVGTVTSVSSGFGTTFSAITTSGSVVVDSNVMATKAALRKTEDSLNATIATKGSGTVTSVATSTGIIGGTITTTGTLQIDSSIVPKWDDTLSTNRKLVTPTYLNSLSMVNSITATSPLSVTAATGAVTISIASSSQARNFGAYFTNPYGVLTTNLTVTVIATQTQTITGWYVCGDVSGSITLGLTDNGSDMIGAGNAPLLSSAQTNNASVSGWTSTTITAGHKYKFTISGISSVTSCQFSLTTTL